MRPDCRRDRRTGTLPLALVILLLGVAGCGQVWSTRQVRRPRERLPRPAAARQHVPPRTPAAPEFPYLLLKLGERRLYLVEDASGEGRSFPVAIGRTGYETPIGRFRVEYKLKHPEFVQPDWDEPSTIVARIPPGDPRNPLGARWIGFATAYGWDIGFHGTPRPELLGRAVSHGCVRMSNPDVIEVYERVVVGTTVIVQP